MRDERPDQPVGGRRDFLRAAVSAAGLVLAGGCATPSSVQGGRAANGNGDHDEAEVTPAEDLMQEHGVVERILLIYDECAGRIERQEPLEQMLVLSAAGIIRRFVEDYHEKLEEQYVFPRLQAANRETELVAILLLQHQRGRMVTDDIIRQAGEAPTPELAQSLRTFVRMYRPHIAREDTVLFPVFREVVGPKGYRELGEQFEEKEHELFGPQGFETTVGEVADLEAALGIGDLAKFTPR